MSFKDSMIKEFDAEMAGLRRVLERVPDGKPDYRPHPKSRPLNELATHLAQLAGRAADTLTTDERAIDPGTMKPLILTSRTEILKLADDNVAKSRAALMATTDKELAKSWKFTVAGKVLFTGTRLDAYRAVFLNHLLHHRAQLGVYLRLLEVPVPGLYGPTADEPLR